MIGATGERSARTPGGHARETDELRPPERQRGLLSFLTWPVLLAQASVAEAAFGDQTSSLHSEEEHSDAAARFDARNPAPADDQVPGAPAGSIGRDELTEAVEGPALPGFEEGFARIEEPEADDGEHAASLAHRSADDPEAQGGGGGGGGGSSSSRPADPRSASTDGHALGGNVHAAAPEAARAHAPTVSFDDPLQLGDSSQALLQAMQSAPASIGGALIGGTLTGVVDAGFGTVAAAGQSVSPLVTDKVGVATDVVDVALQPVSAALDIVVPVVDSAAPVVTGVAGVATDIVDVALQPVSAALDIVVPVVDGAAPVVTGVADVATDVVDVALQPIGSTLETVQPVVASLAATATDIAEPVVDVIPPVVESVPAAVTGIAGVATEAVDVALQSVGSALETVPATVESVPPTIIDLAGAAIDLGGAASQPTEPLMSDVRSLVPDPGETATGLAGISAEAIAPIVENAPPIVSDIADVATDTGEPLVTTALDSVQRIGGDSPSDADADLFAAGVAPDALDAGSVGTLGGALASGGVIEIDGGPPPTERASTDDGGYTDLDLSLRNLTLGGQGTKPADGRTNEGPVDEPHDSRDESDDNRNDGTSEAAGAPSSDERGGGADVGADTLLGSLTHTVDEVALRGDHHLL